MRDKNIHLEAISDEPDIYDAGHFTPAVGGRSRVPADPPGLLFGLCAGAPAGEGMTEQLQAAVQAMQEAQTELVNAEEALASAREAERAATNRQILASRAFKAAKNDLVVAATGLRYDLVSQKWVAAEPLGLEAK
jgi:hypothetical protein